MSFELPDNPTWIQVLDAKVNLVHQQIAALQRWNEEAGGDKSLLDQLCATHYETLHSIYEEDYPLARAIESSDLLIQLEGPAVDRDNPRLSLIASVFSSVRKQVGGVANALNGVIGRFALPKELDLGLSGLAKGSLYLGFAIPAPDAPDENGALSLLGADDPLYQATKQAIRTIGLVTRSLESEHFEEELANLIPDAKVRDIAVTAVHNMAPSGRTGISSVSIGGKEMGTDDITVLTPAVRTRMHRLINHPVQGEEKDAFTGVVREIDLDFRRFEIRRIVDASLEDIRCVYTTDYDSVAETYLNKKVRVFGKVERSSDGTPRMLEAETINILSTDS